MHRQRLSSQTGLGHRGDDIRIHGGRMSCRVCGEAGGGKLNQKPLEKIRRCFVTMLLLLGICGGTSSLLTRAVGFSSFEMDLLRSWPSKRHSTEHNGRLDDYHYSITDEGCNKRVCEHHDARYQLHPTDDVAQFGLGQNRKIFKKFNDYDGELK